MRSSEASAGRKTFRGFTLIELLVVLAIITVISGIIFTSQSTFNKTLILANTAYDVALSLRSAETYGLGGHAMSAVPTGYGLHFDKAAPGSFLLFADSNPAPSTSSVCHTITDPTALDAQPGDCAYKAGLDTLVTSYTLGNNITISDFCAYPSSGSKLCASLGNLSTLDIVFARPNPDPLMSANGLYSSIAPVTSACLTITSPLGGSKYVSVEASGDIVANAAACP
ncbi:MAG TPA: type II secretion system protein [Candidatus Paceibacterota bacterium]|nr:type II secretion system protein [Candidatus Paceibacterota bacterium]